MQLKRLNFGGIYGAIVAGGGAVAIFYLLNKGQVPMSALKIIGLAALGGATLGNWIWRLAAPTDEPRP